MRQNTEGTTQQQQQLSQILGLVKSVRVMKWQWTGGIANQNRKTNSKWSQHQNEQLKF